ncbi:hypothetical protein D3C76_116190 [compost metagenome]
MKCPVCNDVRMREVEKNGVLIDICPDCKGVWLDRGELEKLLHEVSEIEASYQSPSVHRNNTHYGARHTQQSNYTNQYNPSYSHSHSKYNKYNKHHHKKKKSVMDVLGDLFD